MRDDEVDVRVTAQAGGLPEEEPRRVEIRGRWVDVQCVHERWREPRGRYFRVELVGGARMLLLCRDDDLSWHRVLERGREH